MTGCTQTKLAHIPKIDNKLPSIQRFQSLNDITTVALEWEPIVSPKVQGYYIYRKPKDANNSAYKRIAIIRDKYISHYVDTNLATQSKFQYTISTYNEKQFESKPSKVLNALTHSVFPFEDWIVVLNNLPRKAKLIWRHHSNKRINGYIVERKTPAEQIWKKIATLKNRYTSEYIDNNLDDNQVYQYRVRAVSFDNIISTPSDIVAATTKALPNPVTDLTATRNLPKKIRLNWKASTQKGISHYTIYRSKTRDSGYVKRAKVIQNTFEDNVKNHNDTFFYQVSVVDSDGLESIHTTSLLGSSIARPAAINLRDTKREEAKTTLVWSKGDDRAVKFKVLVSEKMGFFDLNTTEYNTTDTTFTFTQKPNVPVQYEISAFDKYGIESEPTKTADLVFEKVVQ